MSSSAGATHLFLRIGGGTTQAILGAFITFLGVIGGKERETFSLPFILGGPAAIVTGVLVALAAAGS